MTKAHFESAIELKTPHHYYYL
jgi:hypothetical protein